MSMAAAGKKLRLAAIINLTLDRVTGAASLLILPLALLLCAQWPLRDWLQLGSREANDLAQLLFGLYVSVGISHATRCGAHLTPNAMSRHYSAVLRQRMARAAALCIALPWSGFMLYAAAPGAWQSLRQLEGFADSFNPGYFILRLCVCLLALLVGLQALLDVVQPHGGESG